MVLLPNLGRDASSLSVLQVGVEPTGNVAGSASDQNVFQLDGGNNSDDMPGTRPPYCPQRLRRHRPSGGVPRSDPDAIESIEEFKVGTATKPPILMARPAARSRW